MCVYFVATAESARPVGPNHDLCARACAWTRRGARWLLCRPMSAEAVIALVASGLAAIIAVVVPHMTFRLALRQDQARWLRDRRADTYVDLLTEAHAERQYFEHVIADEEVRARRKDDADLRLPPLERARLGSRGTIFSSREVNVLFNRLEGVLSRESLVRPGDEHDRAATRVRVIGAFEELQDAIRRELGADEISLTGQEGTARTAAFREGPQRAQGGGGAKRAD
jgi:hypothetical protein